MAFETKVTLEDWLTAANRDAEHGVLTAVRCNHVIVSESGQMERGDEIVGRIFAQGKAWSAKEEAALILGKCQIYAQELRGVQTFKLFAYYGQEEPKAFHYVTATGRTRAAMGETEDASPRGQTSQGMRMADLVVNKAFAMIDRNWQVTEHLMSVLERERNYYHGQFREAEGLVHEFLREKIEQSGADKMKALEFERASGERMKFLTMLPAFLRHLTGDKNIVPEDLANTSILETAALVIRKMSKNEQLDTMTKLAGVSPELAMVLGGRIQEITQRQERDEEAVKMLAAVKTEEAKEADRALAAEALGMEAESETPRLSS